MNKTLPAMFAARRLGAASAGAADLGSGEAKAKEVCQACHGMDGNSSVPDYARKSVV